MLKSLFIFFCVLFLFGCKTVSVNQETQKTTNNQIVLASIGLQNDNVIQSSFSNTAIPEYKQPIKVFVSAISFDKKTFKAFTEAEQLHQSNLNITYIDSLPNKPKFVSLKIADRVDLIQMLNSKENAEVKNYLTNKEDATIITSVSLALPQQELNEIKQADKVFLVQDGLKNYALQLYNDDVPTKKIQFNEGVVFAYRTSSCCWQENEKHQINIVDLVDGQSSCPNKTYKSAKRAKKKVNYFKF